MYSGLLFVFSRIMKEMTGRGRVMPGFLLESFLNIDFDDSDFIGEWLPAVRSAFRSQPS